MKWMEEHHDIEVNYIEGDDVTQNVTQDVTQGGIQDVTQDGIQDSDLDKWIEFQIAKNPNITTEILAQMAQITSMTIKRHIAKLPHIQYVGSGYSGHWEIKK